MSNYFKEIYDEIRNIILTNYVRFKQHGRFVMRDMLMETDIGRDELIRLELVSETLETDRTISRDSSYTIILHYYNNVIPEIDYDSLTEFSEELQNTLYNYRSHQFYWHNLSIISVNYNVDYGYGFNMTLKISKQKMFNNN